MPWEDSTYLESIYTAKRKNKFCSRFCKFFFSKNSGTTITVNVTSCPFLSIVFLPPQIAWSMQRPQLSSWFHSVKNTKAPHNYFLFNSLHLNISMHILHTFFIHFLRNWRGEFVLQSKASLVGNHFLYSRDLNVWFKADIVRRKWMPVTLRS